MIFNDYSKINIIDNRENPDMYVEGYSHLIDQVRPNQGMVIESKRWRFGTVIYYYPHGVLKHKDVHYIKDQDVILADSKLIIPGVLCARVTLTKHESGIIMFDAIDYLMVLYSNLNNISRGDLIVIGKNQFQWINYRINEEYKRVTFVQPEGIYLVFSKRYGILAGPNYTIEKIKDRDELDVDHGPDGTMTASKNQLLSFSHNGERKAIFSTDSICCRV